MDRKAILEATSETASKAGFAVYESQDPGATTFDIVARRDDELLVVKVLANVDSMGKGASYELLKVASVLEGSPVMVGSHNCSGRLERGVMYLRHSVPMMSLETLREHLIDGVPPLVFSAPGGFYVQLDGERLRRLRDARGLSLGQIADAAGVSRKAIQMYEDGMSAVMDVAIRLEEFLGEPLVRPLDPFSHSRELEAVRKGLEDLELKGDDVLRQLAVLGYQVVPTARCPFDALAGRREDVILTGVAALNAATRARAKSLASVSRIVERYSMLIVDKPNQQNIEGTPVISRSELKKTDDSDELIELIRERK